MFSFASRQQNRMPLKKGQFATQKPSGILQLQEHKRLFVCHHTLLCLSKMHQNFTKTAQKQNLGLLPPTSGHAGHEHQCAQGWGHSGGAV